MEVSRRRVGARGGLVAVLVLLAGATLWGAIGPVAQLAFAAGLRPIELAFWRALLAAPCFALLALRAGGGWPRGRDLLGVAVFGVVGIAGMYGALFAAVDLGGAPLAAVLLYTGPAWVALAQRVLHGQRLGDTARVALVLSLAGVVVLVGPGAAVRPAPAAVVAGLLSGAAFATHFVLAPRYVARFGSPSVYAWAMAAGAVVLAPAARPQLPPVAALPPLVFVVLGSTVLASLCFGYAVTRLAPVRAAVLSTWEPVVATLLAWAVWGIAIGAGQVVGTGMVLASAALMSAGRDGSSPDGTAGPGEAAPSS